MVSRPLVSFPNILEDGEIFYFFSGPLKFLLHGEGIKVIAVLLFLSNKCNAFKGCIYLSPPNSF